MDAFGAGRSAPGRCRIRSQQPKGGNVLKKIITIGAALAVLGGAVVAWAAGNFNNYTATQTFKPSTAGTPTHPSPLTLAEHWTASGTSGRPAAPLIHIVAKNYGLKVDATDFKK